VSEIFGSTYADAYDLLYEEKDYLAECDLLESLFQTYGVGPINRIIDLGCGTGNHAIPLASRGYQLTGVDRSVNMLSQAEKKARASSGSGNVSFECGDVCTVDLGQTFDAGIMMFAVLGYQLQNPDVCAALRTARRHLRQGGLFIFDVWYGPAVLYQRPAQRARVIPTPDGEMLRFSNGELDIQRQLCGVKIHLWRLAGNKLVANIEESHQMRYFFALELELFLEVAGFNLVRLGGFPDFPQEPTETTWNVLAVARAR
jgi:SAM-dependent methyltransferase